MSKKLSTWFMNDPIQYIDVNDPFIKKMTAFSEIYVLPCPSCIDSTRIEKKKTIYEGSV